MARVITGVSQAARRWGGSAGESRELAEALRSVVRGEVRFDDGSRALYATDASNYRQVPIGVVLPRDAEDVAAAVAVCRRFGAPVLSRGGGTSLAGQTCNVAVVLDFSKYMNRVLEIDPVRRIARVQPGAVLDDLRDAAEAYGLTFGPDPSTHNRCTLGGMLGNNACGVHSEMAGKTDENTEELEILTYDGLRLRVGPTSEEELERIIGEGGRRGEIYAGLKAIRDEYADLIRARYPHLLRRVSGFNLEQLLPEHGFHVARALVGSEGTCVTILEASLRLVASPPARTLLVVGYPDVFAAADDVPAVRQFEPIGLEGTDARLIADMKRNGLYLHEITLLPEGDGLLLVEFGGATMEEANARAEALMHALGERPNPPGMRLFADATDRRGIWAMREAAVGALSVVPGQPPSFPGWEDSAVPSEALGAYLRDLARLMDRFGYRHSFYGHFGQGCVHCRLDFDLFTQPGIDAFAAFTAEAADLVVSYGGSLSGEHGDGQARADLLPKMFGPELVSAFAKFKAVWDPDNKMNPGKVVDPYPRTSDLRLGTGYNPAQPKTRFHFAQDNGSMAQATLRCVGVGKCRRHDGGTMCPSYMVTREEQHSTRGRARLLFEMLQGDVIRDGWRSAAVKDALDLCLACKGCKGECPVRVDMATYKAEFLAHYYAGRLRPRSAYALGLIYWWARLASHAPRLANVVMQSPGLRDAAKWLAGVAPERSLPAFARRTFRQQLADRSRRAEARGMIRVVKSRRERTVGGSTTDQSRQDAGGTRASRQDAGGTRASRQDAGGTRGQSRRAGGARLFVASRSPESGQKGRQVAGKRVILWADTFNNSFHPEIAWAALQALAVAGYEVVVPRQALCCGRPLYDFGFLDTAKRLLREILETLRDEIRAGTPVVGLEPSCVAVFRDELLNLFPNDEDARRLSQQTFLLAEFLVREGYEPPRAGDWTVLLHGHCHQKALVGMGDEVRLLEHMGLTVQAPDTGCCGMAGAFGFEREHYEVSLAVGERVLLPAVRAARDGTTQTIVMADGFSCREQIEQATGQRVTHLAQLLVTLLRTSDPLSPTGDVNRVVAHRRALRQRRRRFAAKLLAAGLLAVLAGGGAILAGSLLLRARRAHD